MFLYPPRPERAISPTLIKHFEKQGWIGQLKKNGTCQVISIDDEGHVDFKTRHNEDNKAWTPTDEAVRYFQKFPNSVFVAELLHNKHESVKNTLYIFDVLCYNGKSLVGTTLPERFEILNRVVPMSKNLVIAKNFNKDLTGLYQSLSDPIDEGIVLKDPTARLRDPLRKTANSGWQVKCRKGTKNFTF